MNPIPIDQLSKEVNINPSELKEKLFALIKDHTIIAEISEDQLIQPSRPHGEFLINFYRKVEIIGNKIIFSLRIYNPTKFFVHDVGLVFLFPQFLKYLPENSDPTDIFIQEFEPEAIRIIHWHFKIELPVDKKKFELKKWLLSINYKNPFNKLTMIQKEMDIIL
jgi:hypothetical protein